MGEAEVLSCSRNQAAPMPRSTALHFAAALLCGSIGHAHAESLCQSERSPNDLTFHCIEMGSKRFRIPDGHLAFWQFANPKTGQIERFDTMDEKVRGKFTYFFFVSDLPGLTETDFRNPAKQDDLSRRLTSVVMTEQQARLPILVEQKDGDFVFAERLAELLIARGFQAISSSILKKGETRVWLIRSAIGIGQIEWTTPAVISSAFIHMRRTSLS